MMGAVRRVKNVEWEKNRRDKLNLTFSELSQLLPGHDPSLTLSKVEILRRTLAYIVELRESNTRLLETNCDSVFKKEMSELRGQLSELRRRNHQLLDLLRIADISVTGLPPPHPDVAFSPPRKWRGRISQPLLETRKKEENKLNEKPTAKTKRIKIKNKAKSVKPQNIKTRSKTLLEKGCALNEVGVEANKDSQTKTNTPLKEINNSGSLFPRAVTVPCTTMSLVLSSTKTSLVTVAQSGLLASPIMATGIQPVLSRNLGLSSLGPGTLIMSDGRVVTVPPPVLSAAPSQPAVILMQNIATVKPVQQQHSTTQMRPIVPKLGQDSTRTTYVNKVPISAISASRGNSATIRSRCRRETNKKTVNGKSVEERTETIKKTETKTVIVELVKENQPVTGKQKNKNITKGKVVANISKIITANKSLQNPVSADKKTLSIRHSNSVKRKEFKTVTNITLAKRKKVDDKAVNINNFTKVVAVPQTSVADTRLQMTNKNLNSTSQILASSKTSTERNVKICGKQTPRLETSTSTLEKEIPANSENQNVYNKEQTTKLQTINANAGSNSIAINNKRIVPVDVVTEFNKDVNQSIILDPQKPLDVRVESNVYNLQTPRLVAESNNTTETVTDRDINKSLVMNSEATLVLDNTHLQRAATVTEKATNNNTLANDCMKSNNDFNKENTKRLVTQNCKATQITADQLTYIEENVDTSFVNKTDKTIMTDKIDAANKSIPEKTTIPDVNQDLTNLFPIDPKLQVCPDNIFRDSDFRDRNLFMPISHSYMDEVRLSLPHSDFSNDLFSSLQVPTGGQHPESISPTAAFLMAFPLVSTSKTSEMIADTDAGESQHATPTTILQIGNIDPLYQQTSLMIENNVSDLHDPMKLNKSPKNNNNNNNTKQMKRVEPFQQVQMNDLLHTEDMSRNNCKEKKNFASLQEHNMYMPCNKKKVNGRTCDFPLPNDIISHFQDKPFDFPSSNTNQNGVQNLPSHNRQGGVENSQKKAQVRPDIMADHQNPCPSSSQSYSYNAFPSGSDFSFPSSSYIPTNQTVQQAPKPPQTLSNFTSSWSTSSVTATSNCVDYTSPYCSYPQKSYINAPNSKSTTQKLNHSNYDNPRLKEKTPSINSLPKFSANFQFNGNQSSLINHLYPNTNQTENGNYKIDSKTKKQKVTNESQRPPVNWMTTPDVRPVLPDSNIAPVLPDILFPPQKELDFNSSTNNVMFSTSNNSTPFNISSTVANNSQTLYPNSHFSGIDFQLDFAPFPEITSTKPSKTVNTTSSNQFSWSPNKTSLSLLPHIDSHMIPSTLPTLVGDLALGTTTPSGPIDTFRNLNMPTTPFILDTPNKKCDSKSSPQKAVNKSPEKDCFSNSERRNSNKNIAEYCQKTQSHQSTNTTSSFLSVSQLVDPVKSEQVTSRRSLKQTVVSATKTSASVQKRNITHQTDKLNHSKISSNISVVNNYHLNLPNPVMSNQHQRKAETFQHNQPNSNYPNVFANNLNPAPWQNSKPTRTSNFKGGSYSAESLIAEHQPQNPVPELPPFSVANQYGNSQKVFMDAPIVSSATYSGTDFSHQNVQPLDFQQAQHSNQNCFNFPTHNTTHYSEDYHNIGLDSLYSMNHPPSKTVNKRNPPTKRREEMAGGQQMQYFPRDPTSSRGVKCPSPTHHGTSSVTNFNLSTIFPEINDKRVVQGTNSYHSIGSKLNDNSTGRPSHRGDYTTTNFNPQMQQARQAAPPMQQARQAAPPVSFANISQPLTNFRPQ